MAESRQHRRREERQARRAMSARVRAMIARLEALHPVSEEEINALPVPERLVYFRAALPIGEERLAELEAEERRVAGLGEELRSNIAAGEAALAAERDRLTFAQAACHERQLGQYRETLHRGEQAAAQRQADRDQLRAGLDLIRRLLRVTEGTT